MFDNNHPRRYAQQSEAYPNCVTDLDFVAVFNPENERDLTPISERWFEVLVFMEAEIRALHRQLAADREAACAGTAKPSVE